MSNEIKVGDKVRFNYDTTPRIYLIYSNISVGAICIVDDIQDGNSVVKYDDGEQIKTLVIPTKYLVKVDAEKKEAKFKKGDKVRYIGDIQEHKGEMFVIDGDILFNDYYKQWQASSIKTTPTEVWGICNVPLSDLEPDTKPTEQTEAEEDARIRQKEAELEAFRKSELDRVLHPEKSHTYEVTVDNVAMDWQRYEADLTKEVALKVANKFNSPYEAAEYAVSVAKAVVEGLKRK